MGGDEPEHLGALALHVVVRVGKQQSDAAARSLGLHVGRERGPPVAFRPDLGEPDGRRPGRTGGEQGSEDDDDGEGSTAQAHVKPLSLYRGAGASAKSLGNYKPLAVMLSGKRQNDRHCLASYRQRAPSSVQEPMDKRFNFGRLSRRAVDALTAAPAKYRPGSERLAKAVTGLASLAALAVGLAFPAAYLVSAVDRLTGVLEVRAQLYADNVSDAAAESPELYNALLGSAEINLDGLAIAAPDDPSVDRPAEWRQVFAADGHQLLEVAAARPIAWPVLSSGAPVLQNGHRLGEVEITRSLRPQLLTASTVAVGSFTLGLLLLIGLRVIPLRLMHEALDARLVPVGA